MRALQGGLGSTQVCQVPLSGSGVKGPELARGGTTAETPMVFWGSTLSRASYSYRAGPFRVWRAAAPGPLPIRLTFLSGF